MTTSLEEGLSGYSPTPPLPDPPNREKCPFYGG